MNTDPVFAFLAGINTAAAGFCIYMAITAKRKTATDKTQFKLGYTTGLDIGCKVVAQLLERKHRKPLHGFAIQCRKCKSTIAAVQSPKEEYCQCQSCGHINPSPLQETT